MRGGDNPGNQHSLSSIELSTVRDQSVEGHEEDLGRANYLESKHQLLRVAMSGSEHGQLTGQSNNVHNNIRQNFERLR